MPIIAGEWSRTRREHLGRPLGRGVTPLHRAPAKVTNGRYLKVKTPFRKPAKGLKTQENEDGRWKTAGALSASALQSPIFYPQSEVNRTDPNRSEVNRTQNNEKQ